MLSRSRATVAVVGAGLMGHGIAQVLAEAGHAVAVHDADAGRREQVHARIRDNLVNLGHDDVDATLARITVTDALESAAAGARLVVEAVSEDLELKRGLFSRLGELAPSAILATNTSVMSVTAIARDTARPERVVGTHWWNPPFLVPLVEVVQGEATSLDTIEEVMALLTAAGKSPVHVRRDVPGFVGNRLQHSLWREAFELIRTGVCDAETVDRVVRDGFGPRLAVLGPVENADYIGLDLTLSIHAYLLPHLQAGPVPSPLLREHVAAGRLGAKTGSGFLDWPAGAADETTRRLRAHLSADSARRGAADAHDGPEESGMGG